VAKIEGGAIFATTMCLASTEQARLVYSMISCHGGKTAHLPDQNSFLLNIRSYWKTILSGSSGAIAGYLVAQSTDAVNILTGYFPWSGSILGGENLTTAFKVALVPLGMAFFEAGRRIWRSTKLLFMDFVGY
jgi:hypothetical protein